MPVDPRQLRDCLGHFATGVTVVTCDHNGQPHGATVNSFAAVSLDPALIMISLDRRTKACHYVDRKPFTVNVLRSAQGDMARHFAGQATADGVDWVAPAGDRPPRLAGTLAHLDCEPWRTYDGGDHLLFVGEVTDFEFAGGDPLVFYLGTLRHLGPAFDDAPWLGSLDSPDAGWFSLVS